MTMTHQCFWFDTEFIEDGRTIELLAIGIVSDTDRTYYAEPAETDRSLASPWVQEHVLPHLTGPIRPKAQIAAEIIDFVGPSPTFWAYYADYDWVALCQLYGRLVDLPPTWPMYCRDLKQYVDAMGNPTIGIPKPNPEHHALADAIWAKNAWYWLGRYPRHGHWTS